jgi:hypothetical protein
MLRSRWSRLLSALAVLPALLFLLATSYAGSRCSMDGLLRQKCCCPVDQLADGARPEVPDSGTVAAARCCDREVVQVTKPPSEPRRTETLVARLVLPAPAPLAQPAAPAVRVVLAAADSGDPGGRDLLLCKRVLLI